MQKEEFHESWPITMSSPPTELTHLSPEACFTETPLIWTMSPGWRCWSMAMFPSQKVMIAAKSSAMLGKLGLEKVLEKLVMRWH